MQHSSISRRAALIAGSALMVTALRAPHAAEKGCPGLGGQTVDWIVPFSAGGGFDVYSRLIEPFVEREVGAEIVVRNVTGAGGVLGAKTIRDAAPDGRTIGIISTGGLLASRFAEGAGIPDPVADFSVLGRLGRQAFVWVVNRDSPIRSVTDLWTAGAKPPVVGILDVGSGTFLTASTGLYLCGLEGSYVAGYRGTKDSLLALIRGEIDVTSISFESMLETVEAGEVRPILQVSSTPIADHPALAGVPLLGGPGGLAAQRAEASGRSPAAMGSLADAVSEVTGAGRWVVGPKALPVELAGCLGAGLLAATRKPELLQLADAAHRTFEVLDGGEAVARLTEARQRAEALGPILAADVARVRA